MAKKTKETIDRILSQAKESIKLLETLQKEAISRAKSMIESGEARKITNQKIVSSLKKMGLATQAEVRELERKVEDLASELRSQLSKISRKTTASGKKEKDETTESTAI